MKYYKRMIGKHVYLSPMNMEDAEKYAGWMNDIKMTAGLGTVAMMVNAESEREWLKQNAKENEFAIVRLKDDELLGNCGIHALNQIHQNAEIGLFIGEEENRGKGYGTETVELLLEYGFEYLNLKNIMLRLFSFNERGLCCYQKAGFQEIGRRRSSYYCRGSFHDEIYMDILREEWLKHRV